MSYDFYALTFLYSSLKDVAKQIGQFEEPSTQFSGGQSSLLIFYRLMKWSNVYLHFSHKVPLSADELESRQQKLQKVIGDLKLHEAWDILEAMKKLVMDDKRGTKVRAILSAHPQLISAMYEIQVKPCMRFNLC